MVRLHWQKKINIKCKDKSRTLQGSFFFLHPLIRNKPFHSYKKHLAVCSVMQKMGWVERNKLQVWCHCFWQADRFNDHLEFDSETLCWKNWDDVGQKWSWTGANNAKVNQLFRFQKAKQKDLNSFLALLEILLCHFFLLPFNMKANSHLFKIENFKNTRYSRDKIL